LNEQDSAKMLFTLLGAYLTLGILCLAVLEFLTKRITEGFADVVFQIANLMQSGERMAQVIALAFIFCFWPAAIYGALERWWRDNHYADKNDKTGKENK